MARLDESVRKSLLHRARAAIARAIGAELPAGNPPGAVPEDLRAGAFVTLRMNGQLRGCIGYPAPDLPLAEVVERCAVSAALADPRFRPLTPAEWREVTLELSALGPIEPVDDIQTVVVGRDGLIAQLGECRGLLLPQVAVERKWDAAEFASQTCIKAGLPGDAWRNGATLFKFDAEVFGESD